MDNTGEMLKYEREECDYKQNIVLDGETLMNEYATHHTKMMVLFFKGGSSRDEEVEEEAQVVIHTANLIEFDWTNMTQGVWRSPRLKKRKPNTTLSQVGAKFGSDFMKYLRKYRNQSTKLLIHKLNDYDFSPIEAVFVASAPGNYDKNDSEFGQWGIVKLQREIGMITKMEKSPSSDYIVAQVSSIATLGATDTYLGPIITNALNGRSFFTKITENSDTTPVKLIFPTVEEVADSLEGYLSGSSIHFKRQTGPQLKQLEYMKPLLHKWNALNAGRQRCAPHIKTYLKTIKDGKELGWFLLTSANLSKHAWGTINKTKGNHWIQSWECGVLIHPQVFHGRDVSLVPVYKSDIGATGSYDSKSSEVVYVRMPFDLPPQKYSSRDRIWSPTESYSSLDWRGNSWRPS